MKIIQLETADGLRKRAIRDTQSLRNWLKELGAQSPSYYVLDANDVERTDYEDLEETVAYHLPTLSRKRGSSEVSSSPLVELIQNLSFDEAWKQVERVSTEYFGDGDETENTLCYPMKVPDTWKGEHGNLVKNLRDQCEVVKQSIQNNEEDSRAGRLVGIRLGSGCGKSHLLLESPRILKQHGIYVTYNLNQSLKVDNQNGTKTILLRILLRLAQIPNKMCPIFFDSYSGQLLLTLDSRLLRDFVVHQLGKIENTIFIGVDEIMELHNKDSVRDILSELGEIAFQCYKKNNHQQCNVFVTSLNEAPFLTASGRAIFRWSPEVPDESAAELILKRYLLGRDLNRCKAMAISVAGFHFRSLVFAAQAIGQDMIPSVQSILTRVIQRWEERVPESLLVTVRFSVIDSCSGIPLDEQPPQRKMILESFLDRKYALPPPLIFRAFGVINSADGKGDRDSPVFGVFNCDFAYTDPAKHLEQFGLHFDLFRHSHNLFVLPKGVHITVPGKQKGCEWFQSLKYPVVLRKSEESLFRLHNRAVILTEHGNLPSLEKYYAPRVVNHPLVDRAFIARHISSGDKCFVLILDRLNKDIPKAVKDLNSAASLIKAKHPSIEVLCIVNVIDATSRSTAQTSLDYPHVLVREDEVDAFYSVNFAQVARFARRRHELG